MSQTAAWLLIALLTPYAQTTNKLPQLPRLPLGLPNDIDIIDSDDRDAGAGISVGIQIHILVRGHVGELYEMRLEHDWAVALSF
jgi:hypothetical protein